VFFILTLPLFGIVLFGAQALVNIGWHLFTLRDCDEAYHELLGQIESAKKDLAKKGMKFDK
jgi:dolichyl-phosphate mannosyltransferase polypeptide 3